MRRDPPQFAEEVEDKATLSSFFSGLPVGGSDEGSNHAVDESGCGFYQTIRMSFTHLTFAQKGGGKGISVSVIPDISDCERGGGDFVFKSPISRLHVRWRISEKISLFSNVVYFAGRVRH
jgi:hypothetical protein